MRARLLVIGLAVLAWSLPAPAAACPQYKDWIMTAAALYIPETPRSLIAGQVYQESTCNELARSKAGAQGLMQIMPGTARDIERICNLPGFDPLNPRAAILGGVCYDAWNLRFVKKTLPGWAGSHEDEFTLMTRGYNGGVGYLGKEARRWLELGLTGGPAVWLGTLCRQFRSVASCDENVGYPVRIRTHARLKFWSWD